MAKVLNDFSGFAQRVWAEPSLVGKQAIVCEMIDACLSNNEKKATFKRDLARMTNSKRIDKFAADMMLRDTDKVI